MAAISGDPAHSARDSFPSPSRSRLFITSDAAALASICGGRSAPGPREQPASKTSKAKREEGATRNATKLLTVTQSAGTRLNQESSHTSETVDHLTIASIAQAFVHHWVDIITDALD